MNTVILKGRLAKDVVIRFTSKGDKVATYTICTNESYTKPDGTKGENPQFINCIAWRHLADNAEQYKKGDIVVTEGRIQTRSYETNTGEKKYITEVVARLVAGEQRQSSNNFDNFGAEPQDIPF